MGSVANNKQYSIGTVSVTNGSTTVTGVATVWTGQVIPGNWFEITGEGIWYDIADVSADGSTLTLATPYLGTTKAKSNYLVQRNFTAYNGYPIPAYGDQDTGTLLGYALQSIDLALSQISPKLTGVVNGDLQITGEIEIDGSSLTLDTLGLSTQAPFIVTTSANVAGSAPYSGLEAVRPPANAYLVWNESKKRWGAYTSNDSMVTPVLANIEAANFYGTVASPSDARLKTVKGPIRNGLDQISRLQGVRFEWNTEAERRGFAIKGVDIGFIAQDVERVVPEAVCAMDDLRFVSHHKLVPVLVEAMKELIQRNADMQGQLKELRALVASSRS